MFHYKQTYLPPSFFEKHLHNIDIFYSEKESYIQIVNDLYEEVFKKCSQNIREIYYFYS